tara:strand:+ start:217 stop:432 length:216 start_codon:yes stop_codon:yes gene_type:complete
MKVLAGQTMVEAVCSIICLTFKAVINLFVILELISAFGEFLTERWRLILGLGWSFVTSAWCWCQGIRNIVK